MDFSQMETAKLTAELRTARARVSAIEDVLESRGTTVERSREAGAPTVSPHAATPFDASSTFGRLLEATNALRAGSISRIRKAGSCSSIARPPKRSASKTRTRR